jgi:hypothetical protein
MFGKFFKKPSSYDQPDPSGAQGGLGSVEELVPVQSVFDNMMVLKDGSFRMLIRSNALNFDLKSPREQRVILNTFGEMLNALSIDFPIQVLLHAAHLDTGRYTKRYRERLDDRNLSPSMHRVIEEHLEYFEFQARANYLLDRSFYVVVPFYGQNRQHLPDGGLTGDMPGGGFLKSMMDGSDKEKTRIPTPRELEIARVQLINRTSLIVSQLTRLGIQGHILEQLEVVQLLRELYNPGISERQKIRGLDDVGSLISLPSETQSRQRQRHVGEGV